MRFPFLLAPLLACLAPPAGATTLVKMDLPALSRAADVVVRARVAGVSSRWSRDGRRILTDVQLRVLERISGECADTLQLVQPGGEVGDLGQKVDGVPPFAPGEEAVLFLERQGRVHALVGLAQGKWTVDRAATVVQAVPARVGARVVEAGTGREAAPPPAVPLDGLVRQVRAARGTAK
jgi:hypothetical protein